MTSKTQAATASVSMADTNTAGQIKQPRTKKPAASAADTTGAKAATKRGTKASKDKAAAAAASAVETPAQKGAGKIKINPIPPSSPGQIKTGCDGAPKSKPVLTNTFMSFANLLATEHSVGAAAETGIVNTTDETKGAKSTSTWSGGGWTCWFGDHGQRMADFGGNTHQVFRVNTVCNSDGTRVVYALNAANDCPYAIGALPADAPADPWAVKQEAIVGRLTVGAAGGGAIDIQSVNMSVSSVTATVNGKGKGKGKKDMAADEADASSAAGVNPKQGGTAQPKPAASPIKNAPLGGVAAGAVGSGKDSGGTIEEAVKDAMATLQPIQERASAALDLCGRSDQALYAVVVSAAFWYLDTPKPVLQKIIEQKLEKPFDEDRVMSHLGRVVFDNINVASATPEVIKANKKKNHMADRIGRGFTRVVNAIDAHVKEHGVRPTQEYVVSALCEPGSGGLSGAGTLLNSDVVKGFFDGGDHQYSGGASGGGDKTGSGAGTGGAGPGTGGDAPGTGEGAGGDKGTGNKSEAPKGGADKKPKVPRNPAAKADTAKFRALPVIQHNTLPASYRVPGAIFAGAMRVGDDGIPVLVATAELVTTMVRAFLPNPQGTVADAGAQFIGGLLVLAHYVVKDAKIALCGSGTVSTAVLATVRSANSVMVTATPAAELDIPIHGAGTFSGIKLEKTQLALLTKVKNGEGNLSVAASTGKGLLAVKLSADGCSTELIQVSAYDPQAPIDEFDPATATLDIVVPDDRAVRAWDYIKNVVTSKTKSKYIVLRFSDGRLLRCEQTESSSVRRNSKHDKSERSFALLTTDLVGAYRAAKRLIKNKVPTLRADSHGLLVVEVATGYGTYTISIPAVYSGSDARSDDFSREFMPDLGIGSEDGVLDTDEASDEEDDASDDDGDADSDDQS